MVPQTESLFPWEPWKVSRKAQLYWSEEPMAAEMDPGCRWGLRKARERALVYRLVTLMVHVRAVAFLSVLLMAAEMEPGCL